MKSIDVANMKGIQGSITHDDVIKWEHFPRHVEVPSGNKPLSELTLTQIYVAIWRHQAPCKESNNFRRLGKLQLCSRIDIDIKHSAIVNASRY